MNLTKEYLDKALENLATKDDLKNLVTKDELTKLETQIDDRFEKQTRQLMTFAEAQTESLAHIIKSGSSLI